MNISKLCYELYKFDWKHSNITHEMEMDNIKDYYEGLVDSEENYTYNDYIFEFGYSGMVYACYDEFRECEYLDRDYICGLLDNEKLTAAYLADVATR